MNEDYPTHEETHELPAHEILQAIGSIGNTGALTQEQQCEVERHIAVEQIPFGD